MKAPRGMDLSVARVACCSGLRFVRRLTWDSISRLRWAVSALMARCWRQRQLAILWTSWVWKAPLGFSSSMRDSTRESKSVWLSLRCGELMTVSHEFSPCLVALRDERCLPAEVIGPVDCWAFF